MVAQAHAGRALGREVGGPAPALDPDGDQGAILDQLGEADWAKIRRKRIGYMFQAFNLVPHRGALANVELPLVYRGMGGRERRRRATDLILAGPVRSAPAGRTEINGQRGLGREDRGKSARQRRPFQSRDAGRPQAPLPRYCRNESAIERLSDSKQATRDERHQRAASRLTHGAL